MLFERRRSSAGFIFAALGAAILGNAPVAEAVPAISSVNTDSSNPTSHLYSRSRPEIYEKKDGFYQSKNYPVANAPPPAGSSKKRKRDHMAKLTRRSDERILRARQAGACLDSTYNEDDINYLLWSGGPGTVVQLCPGAVITTVGAIIFNNPNQELSTQGYPTGALRAKLVVTGEK